MPPSQNFPIASNFITPLGSFAINRITLADFDTTTADAFGTSVAGTRSGYGDPATAFGPGWDFAGADRNSSTDPRLPLLTDADAVLPGTNTFQVGDPAEVGGASLHNPFTLGAISNLNPSDTYVVCLFRYELVVNGQLDAGLAAQGLALDAPDALVVSGGTGPAGDPTIQITAFPTIVTYVANANPYCAGFFPTDAAGDGAFDVVLDGSGGLLYATTSGDPSDADMDLALVSRNDDSPTTLPRYNYLVITQGAATTAAQAAANPHAMRIQIGQDFLSGTGAAINNAYRPFPLQFTVPQLVGAPGGAGRPDSMTILYNDLEQLSSGVYQQWLVNPETGTMITGRGTYNKYAIVEVRDSVTGELISSSDSLVETVTATSAFVGDASIDLANNIGGFRHEMVMSDASLNAGDVLGFQNWSVLTTTVSAGGTIPDSRPFWFQYTDQNGTPTNFFDDTFILAGGTTFGNFDLTDPDNSRVYISSGAGTGGIVTTILSSDLQNLSRPPIGYVLEGWVFGIPATFTPVRTNDVTSPAPEFNDLTDADIDDSLADVTPNGILAANFRLDGASVELDYTKFGFFQVTLEPKLGLSTMGPIAVQLGALPEVVINPPEE